MGRIITILILMGIVSGCVKENYDECPDWGKYRVLFYDKTSARERIDYNVIIHEISTDRTITQNNATSYRYVRTPDTTQLKSGKVLKLFPGDYSFNALLSRASLDVESTPGMRNGHQYLFADTTAQIIKAGINPVELDFQLANSLIVVKCHFDTGYAESHQIFKIEISCPDDDFVAIDMLTGLSNYAQTVSSFYEECLYDDKQESFYYYCVPVINGNYLNFKVYVRDNNDMSVKTLLSGIFLKANIEQGKAYLFQFNVTPYEIEYMTTTVIDWTDYCHNTIITFY